MAPDEPQLRVVLEEGLTALGLPAEPASVDRWAALALLLDRWSERINLTGHRGALAIAERLLLEAAALSQVLPPAQTIADLGLSGQVGAAKAKVTFEHVSMPQKGATAELVSGSVDEMAAGLLNKIKELGLL